MEFLLPSTFNHPKQVSGHAVNLCNIILSMNLLSVSSSYNIYIAM